jgi:hypothetical protein
LFFSPKLLDHLLACIAEAGTVMSNSKKMPTQAFSKETKKGQKIVANGDHLMAIKFRDLQSMCIFIAACDEVSEVYSLRE